MSKVPLEKVFWLYIRCLSDLKGCEYVRVCEFECVCIWQ